MNSKEYRLLEKRECAQMLLGLKNPKIIMHVHPDADTVGTAAALIRVYEQLGIAASYVSSDKIPDRLKFIIEGAMECTDLSTGDFISVDVASVPQLGSIADKLPEISLMIDHHEIGEAFAPCYKIPGESSAAEVLFGVIEELVLLGKIKLTREIASPLYAALCSDTGRFSYSSTTPDSYRMAARLIEAGADHARINHLLFSQKAPEQIRAEGLIASKIELYYGGKIAAATLTKNERTSLGIAFEHFDTAVDIVRSVRGAEIAFIVKETDEGKIKASLRSTRYDVASIAAELSGGGHRLAAGCSPNAPDVYTARDIILDKMREKFGDML